MEPAFSPGRNESRKGEGEGREKGKREGEKREGVSMYTGVKKISDKPAGIHTKRGNDSEEVRQLWGEGRLGQGSRKSGITTINAATHTCRACVLHKLKAPATQRAVLPQTNTTSWTHCCHAIASSMATLQLHTTTNYGYIEFSELVYSY